MMHSVGTNISTVFLCFLNQSSQRFAALYENPYASYHLPAQGADLLITEMA